MICNGYKCPIRWIYNTKDVINVEHEVNEAIAKPCSVPHNLFDVAKRTFDAETLVTWICISFARVT